MVFNCMDWTKDTKYEKIHPTQKPVELLERLIELFTDEGDIVIDPVCGSGSTIIAALNKNRKGFGFEIKKDFYKKAKEWEEKEILKKKEIQELGYAKSEIEKYYPTLF